MDKAGSKGFIGGTTPQANPYAGGGAQNYARSLGAIGSALQNMGEQGFKIAAEMQAAKNSLDENKVLNGWDQKIAAHEAEMMREKDPKARIEKTQEMLKNLQASTFADDMAPVVRRRLEEKWQNASTMVLNRSMAQSAQLWVEQAKAESGLRLDRAIVNQSIGDFKDATTDMVEQGIMSPAEKKAADWKAERTIENEKSKTLATTDPKAWLEINPNPSTLEDKANERIARYQFSQNRRAEMDNALDAIYSDGIRTADEIRAIAPSLGARSIARLVEEADKVADDAARAEMRKPEAQAKIIGQLGPMIKGYTPTGLNDDVALFQIRNGIAALNDGIIKDRFEAQLQDRLDQYQAAKEANEKHVKSLPDWAFLQIEEHAEAGGYSTRKAGTELKEPRGKTIDSWIRANNLGNQDLLTSFGFSEAHADKIIEANEKWRNYERGETTEKPKDQRPEDLVRAFWDMDNARDENFDKDNPVAAAMFQAIYEGKTGTTMIQDPRAAAQYEVEKKKLQAEIDTRKGEAMRELGNFLMTKPDATREEILSFLKEANINIQAGATDERMIPEAPTMPDDLAGLDIGPSLRGTPSGIKVFTGSRDQMENFTSTPGNRKFSFDFNDASNKTARGIEFVLPSDATDQEIVAGKTWAKNLQGFFKKHGVNVPIRGDGGIALKSNGARRTGKKGVFHFEPFFAANEEARDVIMAYPEEFAQIAIQAFGDIEGATFMAPHTLPGAIDSNPGEGAMSDQWSEREFAMKVIIPALLRTK